MRALLLAVLGASALVFPAAAVAQEGEPSFALKPVGAASEGYYVFDGTPGGVIEGRVLVVNAGDATGTARLDAVDATTGATTGAVYETVGEPSEDVGAWVALAQREVTLGSGESTEVAFAVTVPADARRGEHLGGIVAAPVAKQGRDGGAEEDDFSVDVVNQSIIAVQVDLPGAARQVLAVRDVESGGNPGYQTLMLALSNPGERMVRGRGRVVLRDAQGAVISRQEFPIDTFLPRTRIDYPLVLRGEALVPGQYTADVELDWGAGSASDEFAFAVSRRDIEHAFGSEGVARLPGEEDDDGSLLLPIAGIVLALLLGAGLGVLLFRRHARRLEERILARQETGEDEPRFTPGAPAPQRERTKR